MLEDYTDIVAQHIVYVAQSGTQIVGVVVLMEHLSPILLDNIAVDPKQRGCGLGRRLLSQAERIAGVMGHESIQLYKHELMYENLDYYRKHGYEISHRVCEKGYQRIYMIKHL